MHTLEDVRKEYDRLDRMLGLDSSAIELKISRRAVRQLGCFRAPRYGKGPLSITLSSLILDEEELFWDTIRHEYAHAACYLLHPGENHGHDELWQNICRLVGCNPNRLAPETEESRALRKEKANYMIRCNICHAETRYFRCGNAVKTLMAGRGDLLRCNMCGGNSFTLFRRVKEKE